MSILSNKKIYNSEDQDRDSQERNRDSLDFGIHLPPA